MEQQNTSRDVFMYLLVIIVLAMSAVNLGTLLFQYVNIYVPDAAIDQCYGTSCEGSIRWSLASIIVVFPVLIWAWRFLQRDLAQHPEKADSRVRRWLIYLTLFVSAVTLIGDAVSLIYGWLQGDLTVQFLLKVLIVMYIAGSIFYYFLKTMHPNTKSVAPMVAWIAIVVVIASVVVGFVASGSPFSARAARIDEQRVTDLQSIQNQLVYAHWQSKGALPATLADLEDPINGFVVPVDPQTKAPYEYSRTSTLVFTLCATFTTESSSDYISMGRPVSMDGMNSNWTHGIGRVCFDRTIDPQLYPVTPKPAR